jgi:hypothetical protein
MCFDRIELPPSLAQLDAFLRDETPDAYGKAVDGVVRDAHTECAAGSFCDIRRTRSSQGTTGRSPPRLTANTGFRFKHNPADYEKHDRLSEASRPAQFASAGCLTYTGSNGTYLASNCGQLHANRPALDAAGNRTMQVRVKFVL